MRQRLCISVVIALAVLLVFWRVQQSDFLRYDDHVYVTANATVQLGLSWEGVRWAFSEFQAFNWHPLTWLSHMLDYELYALNPAGHHLTSLLLHAANSVLLFWVFVALTGATWRSAFLAGLFALHPLHVESVAWISERKDVLSTFFGFIALLFWADWARRRRIASYAGSFVAFAASLLAKPMLVTLPFALLLFDFWPLRRYVPARWRMPQDPPGEPPLALLLEKLPLLALTLGSALLTLMAQNSTGAVKSFEEYPASFRLVNVVTVYPAYLVKTFWPVDLMAFYPYPAGWMLSDVLVALLFLVVITLVALRRAGDQPFLLVGWLWYVGTLVPVVGIVQVGYQQMADRYTYIPLIGIFAIVCWGATELAARYRYGSRALAALGTAVLLTCSVLSWQQIGHWKDNQTLFEHAISVDPDNWLARFFISSVQINRGELEPAIENLRLILTQIDEVPVRHNLATALWRHGEFKEAWQNFAAVLQKHPNDASAHLGAARVARDLEDYPRAVHHYGKSLEIKLTEESYLGLKGSLLDLRRQYPDQSFVPAEVALLRAEDQLEYFMGRRFDEPVD